MEFNTRLIRLMCCMNLYCILCLCELESEISGFFSFSFFLSYCLNPHRRRRRFSFFFFLSRSDGGGDFIFILIWIFIYPYKRISPIHTEWHQKSFLRNVSKRTKKKLVLTNEVNECFKLDFFFSPFILPRFNG